MPEKTMESTKKRLAELMRRTNSYTKALLEGTDMIPEQALKDATKVIAHLDENVEKFMKRIRVRGSESSAV